LHGIVLKALRNRRSACCAVDLPSVYQLQGIDDGLYTSTDTNSRTAYILLCLDDTSNPIGTVRLGLCAHKLAVVVVEVKHLLIAHPVPHGGGLGFDAKGQLGAGCFLVLTDVVDVAIDKNIATYVIEESITARQVMTSHDNARRAHLVTLPPTLGVPSLLLVLWLLGVVEYTCVS
jgi:hypothetical protein